MSGFVRGGGTEQYANNSNPAYNREGFEEAHDLIIKPGEAVVLSPSVAGVNSGGWRTQKKRVAGSRSE